MPPLTSVSSFSDWRTRLTAVTWWAHPAHCCDLVGAWLRVLAKHAKTGTRRGQVEQRLGQFFFLSLLECTVPSCVCITMYLILH